MGPIMALESLPVSGDIVITSDSQYVVSGANAWMPKWKRHGWRRGKTGNSTHPILNLDLWQRLDRAIAKHRRVRFEWVRGYAGHPENERADQLAVAALRIASAPPATVAHLYGEGIEGTRQFRQGTYLFRGGA